jgi:acetyl-CoA carboxylase biotin carboxyl carrier protein
VDRLTTILERSELAELEVEAGGTALVLRKAQAISIAAPVSAHGTHASPPGPASASSGSEGHGPPAPAAPETMAPANVVRAPLTGIFYGAPSPGSAPYVRVGGEVAVGQVIGLIEAMKLFNEIKSDVAGRVVRVLAENGQLVKAKQPLLEVEPL